MKILLLKILWSGAISYINLLQDQKPEAKEASVVVFVY